MPHRAAPHAHAEYMLLFGLSLPLDLLHALDDGVGCTLDACDEDKQVFDDSPRCTTFAPCDSSDPCCRLNSLNQYYCQDVCAEAGSTYCPAMYCKCAPDGGDEQEQEQGVTITDKLCKSTAIVTPEVVEGLKTQVPVGIHQSMLPTSVVAQVIRPVNISTTNSGFIYCNFNCHLSYTH